MGLRRKSREIALQFLFEHDFQGHARTVEQIDTELERFVDWSLERLVTQGIFGCCNEPEILVPELQSLVQRLQAHADIVKQGDDQPLYGKFRRFCGEVSKYYRLHELDEETPLSRQMKNELRSFCQQALVLLSSPDLDGCGFDAAQLVSGLRHFQGCLESLTQLFSYVRFLGQGVCRHCDKLDQLIITHSHNWRLERMSIVDRNILRIALLEMNESDDVPTRVAINEALEIAKQYSNPDSVSFINGILDAAAAE
ncbi:transcription antitermination factor NusB [Desulfolithobacter sp.]